jgi:hypothetical protein
MRIFREYPEIGVFPAISGVFQSGCSPFEQKNKKNYFSENDPPIYFICLKMQKCDSKSLKTASTVHKTSKILLFFEFLFIYMHGDVICKISGFFVSTILSLDYHFFSVFD